MATVDGSRVQAARQRPRSLCSRHGPITMAPHRMRPDLERRRKERGHQSWHKPTSCRPSRRRDGRCQTMSISWPGSLAKSSASRAVSARLSRPRPRARSRRTCAEATLRLASSSTRWCRGLSDDEAETLVRAFTNYFQLINLAEDSERIRRIRNREVAEGGPRRGSLMEAVRLLAEPRDRRRATRSAPERRPDSPRSDGPSDRGAPAHRHRQARAHLRHPARP